MTLREETSLGKLVVGVVRADLDNNTVQWTRRGWSPSGVPGFPLIQREWALYGILFMRRTWTTHLRDSNRCCAPFHYYRQQLDISVRSDKEETHAVPAIMDQESIMRRDYSQSQPANSSVHS